MAVKNEIQSCVSRRKARKPVIVSIKDERKAYYKKVALILKKPEEVRNDEEKSFLSTYCEFVKEITRRIENRQKLKERKREVEDAPEVLDEKCRVLAEAIRNSNHLVVYTGAGISTSAQIPDYRGTTGIWTLLQQGKDIGHHDLTKAEPTAAHMALFELHRTGILKYVVSQNCDGLHLRSGLPRYALSELHGNMYLEVCQECKPVREYWRLFDVTERTARFNHRTMRRCYVCCSPLVDTIVHFGETGKLKWPINWAAACEAADKADIILCMGSSLKVLKRYRWLWRMDEPAKSRPKLYIVNLQWTPKDDQAALKISGKCDEVMKRVTDYLKLSVPGYSRSRDPIFSHSTPLHPAEQHTTSRSCLSSGVGGYDLKNQGFYYNASSSNLSESVCSDLLLSNSAEDRSVEYNTKMNGKRKKNWDRNLSSDDETEVQVANSVRVEQQECTRLLHKKYTTVPLFCFSVESGSGMNDCRIICRERVRESGLSSPIDIVYEGVKLKVGEGTVAADACYELSFSYCRSCRVENVCGRYQLTLSDCLGNLENSPSKFKGNCNTSERHCQMVINLNKISVRQKNSFAATDPLLKVEESSSGRKHYDTCSNKNLNGVCSDKGYVQNCDTVSAGEKSCRFKYVSACESETESDTVERAPSHIAQCSAHTCIQEEDYLLAKLYIQNENSLEQPSVSFSAENSIFGCPDCDKIRTSGTKLQSKMAIQSIKNYSESTMFHNQSKSCCTFLKSQLKTKNKLEDNEINNEYAEDCQILTKCLFCKRNYNSYVCLFYHPSIPHFKDTNLLKDSALVEGFSVCMCCKHKDGNSKCDIGVEHKKAQKTICGLEETGELLKQLKNPGWFGKGYRKLTRKRRR